MPSLRVIAHPRPPPSASKFNRNAHYMRTSSRAGAYALHAVVGLQHKRPSTAHLASLIGHPRPRRCHRKFEGDDNVRWCPVGIRLFGTGYCGVSRSTGQLGPGEERRPTVRISVRDLPHKSPQSVSKTKWLFGLERFLREHYTSSSESAAILAAYLKGQERLSTDAQRGHVASQATQTKPSGHATLTKPSGPTLTDFGEEIPRPPADIPDPRR